MQRIAQLPPIELSVAVKFYHYRMIHSSPV
jgi:hypothetical protein